MASDPVISIAERLKARREELGITQSQAARELDVARTAYRLWEMEAAKPAPDRWRLIASWLGVSVTTMLLAEDLITDEEAAQSHLVEVDFARTGRDWDTVGASKAGDFFAQARALLDDGVRSGDISDDQAAGLQVLFDRIGTQSSKTLTGGWEAAELRKALPADEFAPGHARDAVSAVCIGLADADVETATLLVTELVTNSVRRAAGSEDTVGLFVGVGRERLRVEVSDDATDTASPTSDDLDVVASLASRATSWGAGRKSDTNVTWFELDLRSPGV